MLNKVPNITAKMVDNIYDALIKIVGDDEADKESLVQNKMEFKEVKKVAF